MKHISSNVDTEQIQATTQKSSKSNTYALTSIILYISDHDNITIHHLIDIAVLLRIVILLSMAISCYIVGPFIQQHQILPFDDTLVTFPLRLQYNENDKCHHGKPEDEKILGPEHFAKYDKLGIGYIE